MESGKSAKEKVVTALDELFDDSLIPLVETLDQLEDLSKYIEKLIDALKHEIEHNS